MPFEAALQAPRAGVPNVKRAVGASREHALAVGRECDRSDTMAIPAEGAYRASGAGIPEAEGLVSAPREDAPPIGRDRNRIDDVLMSFEQSQQPAAAEQRTLHTNGRYERQTDYDNFRIRLEDLKPYPKQGGDIAPGDYRATLVVTRH